jgi:hypothetical protein
MKSNYITPMTAEEKKYYAVANHLYNRYELPRRIRKARGLMRFNNLGRFYVLDIYTNTVIISNIDIIKWSSNMILNDHFKKRGIIKQGSRGNMTIYGPTYTEEGQKIDYSGLLQ